MGWADANLGSQEKFAETWTDLLIKEISKANTTQ